MGGRLARQAIDPLAAATRGPARHAADGLQAVDGGWGGLFTTAPVRGHVPDSAAFPTLLDPVDVATGAVMLTETDVSLPGLLPLMLNRTQVSSYRSGRLFGPSWACLLDERVEVSGGRLRYATASAGVVDVAVPTPEPGGSTRTAKGRRLEVTTVATAAPDGAGSGEIGWDIEDLDTRVVHEFRGVGDAALLAAVRDQHGNRITIERDGDGLPTGVRHSGGYRVLVETTGGRVVGYRLAGADGSDDGDRAAIPLRWFTFDEAGNLAEVLDSAGRAQRYGYDDAGRMAWWQDRNGTRYAYTYDQAGRCVRGEGTDGVLNDTLRYEVSATGVVTSAEVTDAVGGVSRFEMNSSGQVVREVDPAGRLWLRDWDAHDRPLSRTDPLGRATRWTYDARSDLVEVTEPGDRTTRISYTATGLPSQVIGPDGGRWTYQHDAAGRLAAVTDPSGAVTRYSHAPSGAVASVTDPAGVTTRYVTDAAGLIVQVIDPTGGATSLIRDGFGRVVAAQDAHGALTQWTYTVEGHPTWMRDGDGGEQSWAWDGEQNLLAHTDPIGRVTRYQYTPFDQLAAVIHPDGARTTATYDTLRRLVGVTDALGRSWSQTFDGSGFLTAQTDITGRTVRWERDGLGRVMVRTNASGQVARYGYDEAGELATITADGQTTRYVHDQAGRLRRATSPDVDLVIDRDSVGQVLAETWDGLAVRYTLDGAGRRTSRVTPSGTLTGYTYDDRGHLAALTVAGPDVVGLSVGFDHDPAGREVRRRISGVSGPAGVVDPGWVLEQAWTAAGRLAATAVPGRRRGYSYDGAGNLLGMDDSVTGPVRYGLDTVGRVSTVTVGSGAGRVEQAYGYDLAGMLTTATPPDGADGVVTVGGDAGSAAQDSGRIELRDALPVQAGPDRFRYDRDGRLAARSRARPSLRPATWKYTWDALDRLTMVRTPDGAVWRYRYDGLGRRVAKQQLTGPGPEAEQVGETRYLWDGPHLVEQLHPDHALRTHPAIGTDQGTDAGRGRPFALTWDRDPDTGTPLTQTVSTWTLPRQRDGADVLDDAHSSDHFDPGTDRGSTWDVDRDVDRAFYAIVTDLIGTPIELRTPDGATAWTQAAATIWGHPNAGLRADLGVGGATGPGAGLDESVDCPLRFPGQYHDPETGLHYNLHRYYNPTTASYLTPDPLGLDATPTPHSYVPNPTTWIDPLGLTPYNSAAAGPAPSRFITTRTGTTIDRTAVNTSISAQRQERHVLGARRYEGSSYFNSADDAQRVLDEFHSGVAEVLGIKGNDIVVRTPNVLGVNVNARAGYPRQVTNVFFIKGTSSPSVVPHNPAWAP